MKAWQEDHLHALLSIQSEADLYAEITTIGKEIGFEYCGYNIQVPVPISRPLVWLLNNYPKKWQDFYVEHGYINIDPTVQHCLKSSHPIIWSDKVFESTKELWEQAQAHGLCVGWAQSSRDAGGTVGILTLARHTDSLTERELASSRPKMAWLVQVTHAAMAKLLVPKVVPESNVTLTPREKEVLRWTAEGKTAFEIGCILNVTERTVNFHVNNVIIKLGTSNKIQAAVKAALLGMLSK